jgi:hypothetical protein
VVRIETSWKESAHAPNHICIRRFWTPSGLERLFLPALWFCQQDDRSRGWPRARPAKTPIPGTIDLSVHGDRIVTIHVPVNGTFREEVPTGKYEVAATTPRIRHETSSGRIYGTGSCPGPTIPVTAGQRRASK